MGNVVTKTFLSNGSWTAPAEVTSVTITARRQANALGRSNNLGNALGNGLFIDAYLNAYSVGVNANGQLGNNASTIQSSPVAVVGGLSFKKAIRTFDSTAANVAILGLTNKGTLYGWGANASGILGTGDITPRSSPVAVVGPLTFTDVYANGGGSCYGLTTSGALYAWGANPDGELGDGSVTARSSPVAVAGGLQFTKVSSVGASTALGLTASGSIYAWGLNANGELANGANTTPSSSPVAVVGGLSFTDMCIFANTGFGLTSSGALYSWGLNTGGVLGTNTSNTSSATSSPVAVVGGLSFSTAPIVANGESAMALTPTGLAYAWGNNVSGQIGDGTTTPRSSPVAVAGGLQFSSIYSGEAAGGNRPFFLGLTTSGALYGWGNNINGQLGVGDTTPRSSPVAVVGGLTFKSLDINNSSVFACTVDGRFFVWGLNTNGQLGTNDTTPRSSPVAVVGALGANVQDDVTTTVQQVIPGVSYGITIGPLDCLFGNNIIGAGPMLSVVLQYSQ